MKYTFFMENWITLLSMAAVPITGIITYIFGGRNQQRLQNKKSEQEVKKESATAIEALQAVYDKYIEHDKERTLKLEQRIEILERHNINLQDAFNKMQLSYAIVMEESKKWESMYRKLEKEYKDLKLVTDERETIINKLTKEHNSLKKEFDLYKKTNDAGSK